MHMKSHPGRIEFTEERYSEVAKILRRLRRKYGDSGYDGINLDRALESVNLMKKVLRI